MGSLPRKVKRLALDLRRRARVLPPKVSVIVPFYNVAVYLSECVDSVLQQTLNDIELILVDDGSSDGSEVIAARYARSDSRVRLIRQQNAGPGAARNAGLALARGTYLTFLDSDDRLPEKALSTLVRSADANHADVAAGAIRRFNATRTWVPAWAKHVHSRPRTGIRLQDEPALLRNNYPVAKLYRRRFWNTQQLEFRRGVIYEDQPLIAQMLARAETLNLLVDIVYEYRARDDRSSISQRPEEIRDLRDRVAAWDLSLAALKSEAPEIFSGWYDTIFATHLHWYLNNDSVSDVEYWETLRSSYTRLLHSAPPTIFERISPEKRVALKLLETDRQLELIEFRRSGGYELGLFPAIITELGLKHQLPVPLGATADVTDEILLSRADKLELRQQVVRGSWAADGGRLRLRLEGYAFIPFLDLSHVSTSIELEAINGSSREIITAAVQGSDDPVLHPARSTDVADYRGATYVAEFDFGDVEQQDVQSGRWAITIAVKSGSLAVREPLRNLSSRSGLAEARAHRLGPGHRARLTSNSNRHVPLNVVVDQPAFVVSEVALAQRDLLLTVQSQRGIRPRRLRLTRNDTKAEIYGSVERAGKALWTAAVTLPAADDTMLISWTASFESQIGRSFSLCYFPPQHNRPGLGAVTTASTSTGELTVNEYPRGLVCVTDLHSHGLDYLEANGTITEAPDFRGYQFAITDALGTLDVDASSSYTSCRLRLRSTLPASSGGSEVVIPVGATAYGSQHENSAVPVILDGALLPRLPLATPDLGVIAERGKGKSLSLRVAPRSISKGMQA